jgi:hypothetical protein
MNPDYFETEFEIEEPITHWPRRFAIITAWPPPGQKRSLEENQANDRRLESELRSVSDWVVRITGFSPRTRHAEPGCAVELDLASARTIGHRYDQDAIYFIEDDHLFVTHCTEGSELESVGAFFPRLHLGGTLPVSAPRPD